VRKIRLLLPSFGVLACLLSFEALADGNLFGYYVGAGAGEANPHQSFIAQPVTSTGFYRFNDSRVGWKVMMGLRPISLFGAELEYLDFGTARIGAGPLLVSGGQTTTTGQFSGANAHASAGAGFVLGYLPLPIPWVDVFGKLGVARLQEHDTYGGDFPTTLSNCTSNCVVLQPASFSQTHVETGVGYGAGAQFNVGAFAVRAEFERIQTGLDNPYLVSVGLTWTPGR